MNGTSESLFDWLSARAVQHPQRPAIVANGETITYAGLLQLSTAAIEALTAAGVGPGQRVCILSEPKREFIVGLLGTLGAGAIGVPMPVNDPEQAKAIVETCDPAAAAGTAAQLESLNLPTTMAHIRLDRESAAPSRVRAPEAARSPADTAVILFSSGTTSAQRKAIEIGYRGLATVVGYLNALIPIPEGGAEYLNSPPSHAFGLGRLHAVIARGGTLILDDGFFNPLRALSAVRAHHCTSMGGVSSTFDLLIEKFSSAFADYGRSLRWFEISSMPMTPDRKREMLDLLPDARPSMSYGLTEAMRSVFLGFRDHPGKLHSVGRPAPGVDVSILDGDGQPTPAGMEGEIALRGVNRANGYWRRRDLWASRLAGDWFRTGDHGRIDDEGFVHYLGRNDDVINCGGYKFAPDEVERVAAGMLAGSACVVVGRPDRILGEVPVLCIEAQAQPQLEEDLRAAFRAQLPKWKQPSEIRFFQSLPRTSNGKLLRRKLRELV